MNYEKNYYDYLEYVKKQNRSKKDGVYYEKHHIIPKCMGGTNEKENLVLLTGREHFLAHYLLTKIYPDNDKLLYAFVGMQRIGENQKRYLNSVLYENAKIKANRSKSKRVICIETGEIFESATQAEKLVAYGIRDVIKGKQLTAAGYHWRYENEEPIVKKPFEPKKVICANTKEIFKSFKEAARFANVSEGLIKSVCNGTKNGNAGGYTFYYYEGEKDYPIKTFAKNKTRKVVCVETGEIFNSILEAAKGDKSKATNICACCKGRQKTVDNFHYKYYNFS